MIYCELHEVFPNLAERETRNITVAFETPGLPPPGTYYFRELFCADPTCDCNSAMINVFYESPEKTHVASTLRYFWKPREFYEDLNMFFPEEWTIPGVATDLFNGLGEVVPNLEHTFRRMCQGPCSDATGEWHGT